MKKQQHGKTLVPLDVVRAEESIMHRVKTLAAADSELGRSGFIGVDGRQSDAFAGRTLSKFKSLQRRIDQRVECDPERGGDNDCAWG